MKETKIQQHFFDTVTQQIKAEGNALKLYQDLVHYRFYEVISNANPILNARIDKERFKKIITKFMQSGARTDLIWQLPDEFRHFVKKNKKLFKDMPFINDLLWFEYIEIKLFMQDHSGFKPSSFHWKDHYKLSKSARIKKLDYQVYLNAFDKKEKSWVIVYYDMNLNEVVFREISAFMYKYLNFMQKMSAKEALKKISKQNDLKVKEVQALLKEPLKELCALGVLKKKG